VEGKGSEGREGEGGGEGRGGGGPRKGVEADRQEQSPEGREKQGGGGRTGWELMGTKRTGVVLSPFYATCICSR
jgi:hypothetical protein